jgi:hypothetical protein
VFNLFPLLFQVNVRTVPRLGYDHFFANPFPINLSVIVHWTPNTVSKTDSILLQLQCSPVHVAFLMTQDALFAVIFLLISARNTCKQTYDYTIPHIPDMGE